MKLTHLGHSGVLIDMADTRILIDPGVFTPELSGLAPLDAVIVTHQHPDHLDQDRLPGLLSEHPRARLIAEPETVDILRGLGLDAVTHGPETAWIGDVTVTPVGTTHALINEAAPRIGNVGLRLAAEGEPSIYHPGDTLDEDPGSVDVVLFPLNAPWQLAREMAAFLTRIDARTAIPIHDGLLSANGRGIYLDHARKFGNPDTEIVDLAGAGEHTLRQPA